MADRISIGKKSRPCENFVVFMPIRYSISVPAELQAKFDKIIAEKNINKSYLFRQWYFKLFVVKNNEPFIRNMDEVLKTHKYGDLNKKIKILKEELNEFMDISPNEFSHKWKELMLGFVEENEKRI